MDFTRRSVLAEDVKTIRSFAQGIQRTVLHVPESALPADGRTTAQRDQPAVRLHGFIDELIFVPPVACRLSPRQAGSISPENWSYEYQHRQNFQPS